MVTTIPKAAATKRSVSRHPPSAAWVFLVLSVLGRLDRDVTVKYVVGIAPVPLGR